VRCVPRTLLAVVPRCNALTLRASCVFGLAIARRLPRQRTGGPARELSHESRPAPLSSCMRRCLQSAKRARRSSSARSVLLSIRMIACKRTPACLSRLPTTMISHILHLSLTAPPFAMGARPTMTAYAHVIFILTRRDSSPSRHGYDVRPLLTQPDHTALPVASDQSHRDEWGRTDLLSSRISVRRDFQRLLRHLPVPRRLLGNMRSLP
jgi:hypothetical protein